MTRDSSHRTYRDAREHGFSRIQSAILVWQSIDPDDYESYGTPYERGRELAKDIHLIVKFSPVLVLAALIWVSSKISKRIRQQ